MSVRYIMILAISSLLLAQGCTSNSNELIKSQYSASSCEKLIAERKAVEQKYVKYTDQYSEIKSMWDYGNNDYIRMHRLTDKWERNYTDARDRLKIINATISQKECL